MRFRVLACDFDNTIATDGKVTPATLEALEDVRLSGRRLLLVTGRTVAELHAVFSDAGCFDLVVAENGAVLHQPTRNEEELITDPIAPRLVAELQIRGVSPLCRPWHLLDPRSPPRHRPRCHPAPGARPPCHRQPGCGHGAAGRGQQGIWSQGRPRASR